jgi:hypothetical protein
MPGGIVQKFAQYWKAAVAALAPVFLLVQSAVTDDTITQDEWVKIVVALVAAAAVYVVPNAPKGASE